MFHCRIAGLEDEPLTITVVSSTNATESDTHGKRELMEGTLEFLAVNFIFSPVLTRQWIRRDLSLSRVRRLALRPVRLRSCPVFSPSQDADSSRTPVAPDLDVASHSNTVTTSWTSGDLATLRKAAADARRRPNVPAPGKAKHKLASDEISWDSIALHFPDRKSVV